MAHLSLVKSASHLREEQDHFDEVVLEFPALAFTRGSLIEVSGCSASGKTAIALSLLARLTSDGEICAVVDSGNGFDPRSAAVSGVVLENLLWVRCSGDLEKAFMAADHLVQAKGFGAIWLNLSGLSSQKLQMVPKTYWYRYRTRIKETPTLMFVTVRESVTGSASQQALTFLRKDRAKWSGNGRFKLLREINIDIVSKKRMYAPLHQITIQADYMNG